MRVDAIVDEIYLRYPITMAHLRRAELCHLCALADEPVKMKRQWVHHNAKTGRLIVCTAHDLKPGA